MKFIKILSLSLLVVFLSTSCEDQLDINTNPLVATSADPNAVLPYVFVQYSNRYVTELGTRILDVPQQLSFCYNSPAAGNTSSFLTGNTWFMYYNQVLGNLQLVEQDAAAAGISNNNINAIAKIMKAKSFFELSSLWGDIPFTEALDGANFPSPKFDSQQTVFNGCVDILDEAMALIDAMTPDGNVNVGQGDLIYNGDMTKWRKWANSIKIRILMLMRNKDGSADARLAAALGQPVIETLDDIAAVRYLDTPGEAISFERFVSSFFGPDNESTGAYSPSPVSYDLMVAKGGPRANALYVDNGANGATDIGTVTPSADANAVVSNNIIRRDYLHVMFLPSEISYYRAELGMLGVTGDDVQSNFDAGLRSDCAFWGQSGPGASGLISAMEVDNYVANYGTVTMQDIHEQLYLAGFMRPVYSWNHVRRTGVPTMEEYPGTGISTILKRFDYPPEEVASNINTPANPPTDTKMWFEN